MYSSPGFGAKARFLVLYSPDGPSMRRSLRVEAIYRHFLISGHVLEGGLDVEFLAVLRVPWRPQR